ncbi:MAG TPA: dCMP deaminase family protein [Methanosarcina sp.]|nr:dCMP deaminase family protein [Methanosarcina sp.]
MDKKSKNNKWHGRFMNMAKLVSTWSKDPSTQVGAVIVDSSNRVVSVGFNGLPRGIEDSEARLLDRDVKLSLTIHAEENALLFANQSLEGCSIYVTQQPCGPCSAKLIQKGIKAVYSVKPSGGFKERWSHHLKISEDTLKEAKVPLVFESKSWYTSNKR